MTAPIFAPFSESYTSVEPLFGYRGPRPLVDSKTPRLAARRPFNYGSGREARPCFTPSTSTDLPQLGRMWSSLLELLPQGVIVLSRTLQPIYWNSKAKQLCQAQMGIDLTQAKLPDAVSEACHSLLRDSHPNSASLFVKDERSGHTSLRISARWLASIPGQPDLFPTQHAAGTKQPEAVQDGATGDQSWIAIFLENCDEVMAQEMRIQQKKYDLTEREAEICLLLRKEYTYQEIAKVLQISLNTVKTHVKNIYAKRRSYQGEEKILVL